VERRGGLFDNAIQSKFLDGLRMINDGFHSTDKRENPRKNFEGRIVINQPIDSRFIVSRLIQNISLGGIRVKIGIPASPVQKGDKVTFIINEDYLPLEGEGEIMWFSLRRVQRGSNSINFSKRREASLKSFWGR